EGLKLARNDAMRGVLMPDQLASVNEALVDIVENLEIADGLPDRLARPEPGDAAALHAASSADLSERHDHQAREHSSEHHD
ncbi:AI-2E family transporter, partial [Paraburkholderia sp. SIMBA_030]